MKFDPQKHHRRSIRLKDYDYSQAGAYHVTVVVQNREYFFGEIVNDEMILSEAGKMIDEQWNALLERFPNIELDMYQIMPNHFHGIIVIVGATLVVAPYTEMKNILENGQVLYLPLRWVILLVHLNPLQLMNTSKAWTIKIGHNFTNAFGKEIIMNM